MTNDELRILLLGPQLAKLDPNLPGVLWEAYHGDDHAMREFAEMLERIGRPEQAKRVMEILQRSPTK